MTDAAKFPRTAVALRAFDQVFRYLEAYRSAIEQWGTDLLGDFTLGNPHEMPIPEYVEALQRAAVPRNKDWFAYKFSEPASQALIAESLSERMDLPFEPADIAMTTGGFGAISSAVFTVTGPGDEVIFSVPPWFNYEPILAGFGVTPVKVPIVHQTFDLDLNAIEAAITPQTRMVIVNSPHNPTGKIYPPETLKRLSTLLTEMSKRHGRTIYLLSDEAYNRIVFDDHEFHSPALFYNNTFIAYSYGKTLLTPGQRIGYLAMPPSMDDRVALRQHIVAAQAVCGFAFPNALLQHALPDLERLSIDVGHLQRKRDRMAGALKEMGYQLRVPEGTFYLMPKSPLDDDWAFCERLSQDGELVMPGSVCEMPGYLRICLTASEDMIERSLPVFESAIAHVRGHLEATDELTMRNT